MNAAQRLESYLESLARSARPGERLPTVRQLMAEFGVSQGVVQRATERLKSEGRIIAETGRGTYFSGEGSEAPPAQKPDLPARSDQRSVLFLRRSTSLQRGRRVLEQLQARLQDEECRVVELAYSDERDALEILRNLPRVDACVLQSTFETITIAMLAAAQRKASALVVDGAVLAGTEVDAVGFEWGSAVEKALIHLRAHGHRRIGLVIGSRFVLATELGRIWFETRMAEDPGTGTVIRVPAWPHEDYATQAAALIAAKRDETGALPFSALIVWGIESGTRFAADLAAAGIAVPRDLSVVLLGRTDLENEHAGFFSTSGATSAAQTEALHQAILRRWQEPKAEYQVRYLTTGLVERGSVVEV